MCTMPVSIEALKVLKVSARIVVGYQYLQGLLLATSICKSDPHLTEHLAAIVINSYDGISGGCY